MLKDKSLFFRENNSFLLHSRSDIACVCLFVCFYFSSVVVSYVFLLYVPFPPFLFIAEILGSPTVG